MRSIQLALVGLAIWGIHGYAQQPPQAAPPPAGAQPAAPNGERLDALLQRWEKEMQSVQTLTVDMVRTTKDKVWATDEVFAGKAKYMKPNMAILEMQKKDNAQVYEKFLCTGTFLYQWVPANKVVNVYELPPPQPGQPAQNDFLSFFFGMKAEEAKQRYDLKLIKEDQWYVYIEVVPKLQSDKAEFAKARLVLNQTTFLPRQVWFEQTNGNEVTWDLPKADRDMAMNRNEFGPPQMPPGWNMVKVPRAEAPPPTANLKPSVIRQNEK
jgi:TIGR03009 family protein